MIQTVLVDVCFGLSIGAQMSHQYNFGAQMSPAHAENFALSSAKFSSFRESFARQSVTKDDEDVGWIHETGVRYLWM